MNVKAMTFVAAVVILASGPCGAGDRVLLAQRLLTSSGDAALLHHYPRFLVLHRLSGTLPSPAVTRAASAIDRAFQPKRFVERVVSGLARRVSEADLLAATEWFESPIGIKAMQRMVHRNVPRSNLGFQRYVAGIRASPVSARRKAVVESLVADVERPDVWAASSSLILESAALAGRAYATASREVMREEVLRAAVQVASELLGRKLTVEEIKRALGDD